MMPMRSSFWTQRGTERRRIVAEVENLLSDPMAHAAMATGANPYGDGKAAKRIVSVLLRGRPSDDSATREEMPTDALKPARTPHS